MSKSSTIKYLNTAKQKKEIINILNYFYYYLLFNNIK